MNSANAPEPNGWRRLFSPLLDCLAAIQFLTVMPPVIRRQFTPEEMGRAVSYFPIVGFLIGVALVGVEKLAGWIFPLPVAALLVLAAWVGASGALHLDGFLDACDGLFGGRSPEERLAIMRDERMGAFAFAGGALLLLLKYSALSAGGLPVAGLLLAPGLSRWGMGLAVYLFPYARSAGVGLALKENLERRHMVLATFFAGAGALYFGGWRGMLAMALVGLVVFAGGSYSSRRLQGLTGDIYGALNELAEALTLLVFLAALG